jgi:hypothetical protein
MPSVVKTDGKFRRSFKGFGKMNDNNSTPKTSSVNVDSNILLALEVAPDEPKFKKRMTIQNWREPAPPPDWTITNLFAAGDLYLLYGEPGSKKTWAAMDMAVCVAKGEPWLGMETKRGAVLLVDEESGERRLHDRMYRVLRGHFAENHDLPITALLDNSADFGDPEWINNLSLEIRQANARFVVIDALADVSPERDENSVKDMMPVLSQLRSVARSTGATIVVIHHTNKNGVYRGTSAIKGAVDLMVKLESKPGSDLLEFTTDKERDFGNKSITATITFSNANQVWLSARDAVVKREKFGKADRHVLTYLRDHGASNMNDIANHAEICRPQSARSAVYDLTDRGYARRTDGGGKGDLAVYDLTDAGKEAAKEL